MSLNIAIQMDAIETINLDGDTTYVLAKEAQKRGYGIFYYQPYSLSLRDGKIICSAQTLKLLDDRDNFFRLGKEQLVDFANIDVVLMRQDPPYDMNYLTYTYFLEMISDKTLVINNPAQVRNCPEKIFACKFPELMAPTLISSDESQIKDFYNQHKQIIIKPLYAHGGNDVFKINNEEELKIRVDEFKAKYNHPFILQKYIPQISKGDKRIILIDGEPAGALNRIPENGNIRSNLAQGGTAHKTELTKRDLQICDRIGPELKKLGLILVGIDVIGDYLTEINITSPTGVPPINRLNNTCLEAKFWDVVEKKLS